VEADILAQIVREDVSRIYLDGSNLGRLAHAVRKALPQVEILTFFHNVEARFFLGALRQSKSVRAVGVLLANFRAERMAVRHSHRLLTLSRRDGALLKKVYGREGTDILPMAMEDNAPLPGAPASDEAPAEGRYALFVGGAFYANVAGIRWFAREVAPGTAMSTVVVGRGLEAWQEELERPGNVTVAGPVDRLDLWYRDAAVVIAPIFDGSGMKTKVAEALMFGKLIIGTPEAFSGYEEIAGKAGYVCETAEQFAAALAKVRADPPPVFDAGLRALYEAHFSAAALTDRLAGVLSVDREGASRNAD
jgi:glycosyltransferase involved in cell wall biosynthesis